MFSSKFLHRQGLAILWQEVSSSKGWRSGFLQHSSRSPRAVLPPFLWLLHLNLSSTWLTQEDRLSSRPANTLFRRQGPPQAGSPTSFPEQVVLDDYFLWRFFFTTARIFWTEPKFTAVSGVPVEVFLHMPALHETGKMLPESISLRSSQGTCCMPGLDQDLDWNAHPSLLL